MRSRLISWLVRSSHEGETPLVLRKLCSTLTTYFIRSPQLWYAPLGTVVASLAANEVVATAPEQLATVAAALNESQIVLSLWFASTLADEVSRLDANTQAHNQVHVEMEAIVGHVALLIRIALAHNSLSVQIECLKAFLTWVNYAQPIWPKCPEPLQHLRDLVESTSHLLLNPELRRDALDVFRDILESYTSFFLPQHMKLLGAIIAEHVQPTLLQALQDRDPEALPYGQMVSAFGVANVQDIVEHLDTDAYASTIIKLHFDILRASGYPGDEDELSIMSIEFWNTYVEYVNDMVFSADSTDPPKEWIPNAKAVLTQLVGLLWAKMCTPPGDVAKDWTDAENEGFKDFRVDATDLMLSTFLFLGKEMLQQLVSLTLTSLEGKQWRSMEAALFCLNALADNIMEDQASEETLAQVFSSSLFRELGDFNQTIPSQVRRTAIDVLGSYGQFIERHAEFLPDTIRFLFASLETGLLATTAAKAISALCSSCRVSLTGELGGFLQQYQRFLNGSTSDHYTKEKVIGAIAAIIQALKPESEKVPPLLALIETVEKEVQLAKEYAASGDMGMTEVLGVTALECLASLGNNLQVPDDVPVDIYEDEGQSASQASFWQGNEGQVVQQRIMGCFSVLQVLAHHGAAIEAACQVLRSGFAESEPGPFVLPPSATVSFLQQCSISTPQLESVLQTTCVLITQHAKRDSQKIPEQVRAIAEQVFNFVQQLGSPGQDPGVAQGCIDVMSRMVPSYNDLLVEDGSALAQQLPSVLEFLIRSIAGNDIFPKRSAAEFWGRFIKTATASASEDTRQRVSQVIAAYGPQLSLTLMCQIGGQGQRSDLDVLCEPLKALVTSQAAAKGWLEAALTSEAFDAVTDRVGDAEKRRFLQQLISLRGDKKTKDIAREFYAACRGTVVSFS